MEVVRGVGWKLNGGLGERDECGKSEGRMWGLVRWHA